ncbi:IS3 family transposase, partial [Priestia megaterium]|uniref:IS3 family transposase n=1 Tax=Priestia megaterium TaxID=1404 RepID=UPI00115CB313
VEQTIENYIAYYNHDRIQTVTSTITIQETSCLVLILVSKTRVILPIASFLF